MKTETCPCCHSVLSVEGDAAHIAAIANRAALDKTFYLEKDKRLKLAQELYEAEKERASEYIDLIRDFRFNLSGRERTPNEQDLVDRATALLRSANPNADVKQAAPSGRW